MTGPQALYVESVGKKIAVHSGLSNAQSDFTVTLLNSPVDNAFAIPGGYIYTTRQLVALMNNEAELAGVLAHTQLEEFVPGLTQARGDLGRGEFADFLGFHFGWLR